MSGYKILNHHKTVSVSLGADHPEDVSVISVYEETLDCEKSTPQQRAKN